MLTLQAQGFSTVIFPELKKKKKYRIIQYKSIKNKYKLNHVPTKIILHKKTNHALVLKMFKPWLSQFVGDSHLSKGEKGGLISCGS